MDRRLAAILAADVVGYTRLMRADEAGTLERLKALLKEVIQPKVAAHQGRIVKLMGDGLLSEFPSVVGAVRCAVEIQEAVVGREPNQPDDSRIRLRIGVNFGDIIRQGTDIYGDGVNLAARLEGIAAPGQICVSNAVFEEVKNKLDLVFEDLGEKRLKNIDVPLRVHGVSLENHIASPSRNHQGTEKLSLAVLPFNNMSGDTEQDFLSDGITEDIITALSRFAVLHVVARHSSFAFRGEKIGIKEVGQRLGAQYIVEGGLRRAGKQVRITVQLIEAETGTQIWAERYDREFDDIFALQDEVTRSIVGVLPGRVQDAVAERASRKRTDNMMAYELLLKGKSVRDSFHPEATVAARPFFAKAIALDPRYAKAHAYLADTYFMDIVLGLATVESPHLSLRHAREAMAIDPGDVANHDQLGFAYIGSGQWANAEAQFDKALAKVTNEAEPMTWIAYGLLMLGRPEVARDMVLEAKRLDPLHPTSFDWVLGQACYFAKRYAEVPRILVGEALLNSFAWACLVGAYARLGQGAEAAAALASFIAERRRELASRNITATADTIATLAGGYRAVWRREADWDHLADGLRKAGLPD